MTFKDMGLLPIGTIIFDVEDIPCVVVGPDPDDEYSILVHNTDTDEDETIQDDGDAQGYYR